MTEDQTLAAPALKEIFDRERLRHIAAETASISAAFDAERFMALATENLDDLGIMQRMRQTATSLHGALPGSFERAIEVLHDLAPRIQHGFASIVLSEYVALYGKGHFDLSMQALHYFTRFGSAEFAIRHFLAQDFDGTLKVMRGWALDDNEHVRRLASEGSRPRLPWSFQLKQLIKDPSPTAPILDALKCDSSLYVRKSVANHLNDISKDHPDKVIDRVSGWNMDDARALGAIGTTGTPMVRVEAFAVSPAAIMLGGRITLKASIASTAEAAQQLVVDYAVHYVKKSGGSSKKVFKLKEINLAPGGQKDLSISQAVRDFTTRKHYPGHHRMELIVNGETVAEGGFELRG
ncbi:DNA alkylation repair protein [Aminobacter sp. AP02]|uniref:DNA alkylation repair protein n=1 Tax=Aminobacter sp. AP02 TaxID=2135737 RepID=UPI000D6B5C09|nr:DNA alkylation repair protein [Aminobacter sp. AP02]PWK70539.1 3-methyladenine DNA glycosylase AlkC [Aminobacter sp. AP02]